MIPVRRRGAAGVPASNGLLVALAAQLIREEHLPEPIQDGLKGQGLTFAPPRRWRFDFAWPVEKIALEIEGGTWGRPVHCNHCGQTVTRVVQVRGVNQVVPVREPMRHTSGPGYDSDAEKYSEAALRGWRVIRCTSTMLADGRARSLLRRAFGRE